MNVMVIGGNGFVGTHIVRKLLDAHVESITVYDNMPQREQHDNVKFVSGSILNLDSLKGALVDNKIDIVYHLASVSNTFACVEDPLKAVRVNCTGSVNVYKSCLDAGVGRVVLASSSLISGLMPTDADFNFVGGGYVSDPDYINVSMSDHIYVTTKLFQEMLLRDFTKMYGLHHTILRYGICYGPLMTPGVVVHTFIKQALQGEPMTLHGHGTQWRQYIYVEDLAEANVRVMSARTTNKTYNIVGDSSRVSIASIAKAIQEQIPGAAIKLQDLRSHDLKVNILSNDELMNDLSWGPTTSLEEGIAKTIAYMRGAV